MKKTNAARILEKLKIDYEIFEYQVDENDLSAENVAGKVGIPLDQIFKTLVVRGDKTGIVVACIPGDGQLDLKALASISGNKRVEMVNIKEIQQLTGYIRGGVSPIGMKKSYPTYIDEGALDHSRVMISGGLRGVQILLKTEDLLKAAAGKTARLVL